MVCVCVYVCVCVCVCGVCVWCVYGVCVWCVCVGVGEWSELLLLINSSKLGTEEQTTFWTQWGVQIEYMTFYRMGGM